MPTAKAFGSDGRSMSLAERLEQCVAAAGGLNKAAAAMGMTPQGVRKLIRTDNHRGGPLLPIVELAKAAGVSTDWIATGHDRRPDLDVVPGRRRFHVLYRYEAGPTAQLVEVQDSSDAAIALRDDWLAALGMRAQDAALMTVKGDAMVPTLRDGAMLVVDRGVTAIGADGVYVLMAGRTLAVRRVQTLIDGSVKLLADNASYAPEIIQPATLSSLKVVGRVRGAIITM